MSKEGCFLIYCIELYISETNLRRKEVSYLFSKYGVWEYIYTFYEVLHTMGNKYILNDISSYIEEKKTKI